MTVRIDSAKADSEGASVKHELGPLPEGLFDIPGPIWTPIQKWDSAKPGEEAGRAACALDSAIAKAMLAYAAAEVERAVMAERERCARMCALESVTLATRDMSRGALYCADAIRKGTT